MVTVATIMGRDIDIIDFVDLFGNQVWVRREVFIFHCESLLGSNFSFSELLWEG